MGGGIILTRLGPPGADVDLMRKTLSAKISFELRDELA